MASSTPTTQQQEAQFLHDLGLFHGTDKGFELEKTMTRNEAAVMIARLLGAEKEARAKNYKTPFTDVPEWCVPHVGYLFEYKLTNGVSKTEYGASKNISFGEYAVMLNRIIFGNQVSYDECMKNGCAVATKYEMADSANTEFLRGDAVTLSVKILSHIKGGVAVSQTLVDSGVTTKADLEKYAEPVVGSTFKGEMGVVSRNVLGAEIVRAEVPYLNYVLGAIHDKVVAAASFEGQSEIIILSQKDLSIMWRTAVPVGERDIITIGASENSLYLLARLEDDTVQLAKCDGETLELMDYHFKNIPLWNELAWNSVDAEKSQSATEICIPAIDATYLINKKTDEVTKFSNIVMHQFLATEDGFLYLPSMNEERSDMKSGALGNWDKGSFAIYKLADGKVEAVLAKNPRHDVPIWRLTAAHNGKIYFLAGKNSEKVGFTFQYHYDGKRIYLDDASFAGGTHFPGYTTRENAIAEERARLNTVYK